MKTENIKEKKAIGIYIDGLQVKIAEVKLNKNTFIINNLKEFTLSESLNNNNELDLNLASLSNISNDSGNFSFSEPKDSDIVLDDIEDFMGINDDSLFKNPEKNDTEKETEKEEVVIIPPQYDLSSSKFFEASQAFSQLALKEAQVSFITSEEKLFWNYLPYSGKKFNRNKLKNQILSKEQRRDELVQFDILINHNNTGYSLVYEGVHDTFTLLENIQPILNIKNIKYHHTEPLEIALANAVQAHYVFPLEEYVLILYLSKDNKIAIILQDHNFIKSFPLIIQATDHDIIREAIISKIMLEQDISALNITQNVIIAGDYSSKDDMAYLKDSFKSSYLEAFSFHNSTRPVTNYKIETDAKVNELSIPRFMPSIALCLESLNPKNNKIYNINLLPQLVIDKQKIFKLNWHGFLVLACVFGSTIWTTYGIMQSNIEIKKVVSENQDYQFKINQKKAFQNVLRQFSTQLDTFETGRKQVTEVIKNKNQWAYIFNKISNFTNSHSFFWINEIKGSEDKINILGTSYNKNNITAFSYILPNGSIKKITLSKIEDEVVWDYEIEFNYPDPALYNALFNEINIKVDTTKIINEPKQVEEIKTIEKAPEVKQSKPKPVAVQKEVKAPTKAPAKAITPVKSKQPKLAEIKKIEPVKPKVEKTQVKQRSSFKYTQARQLLQKNDYKNAIAGFQQFINEQPRHRLVPMANYLIAEAYFLSADYNNAISYYNNVINKRRTKVTDSIYKIANCYQKLNNQDKETEYLELLAKKYPRTYYGKRAKTELESLKGDK